MFRNYAAQAGVIAGKNFASVTIEWNFADVVVLGYDPFPSNINDRPRINTWRSDGTNLNYASGGRYIYYPPNSTTGQLFEPWGNRITGELKFNIPLIGNTYAGVDAFIPSGVRVTFEPPLGKIPIGTIVVDPITGMTFTIGEPMQSSESARQAYYRAVSNWLSQNNIGWQKVATIPNEDQYQYLLKIGNNPKLKIELNALEPLGYFEFLTNQTTNINNLMINFNFTGASNINYNLYGIISGFSNNTNTLISL